MLIADPWFAVAAVVAVLVAGISKGGVGGGLGALSVPLLSIAISPVTAAAILLPLLCVMDLLIVRAYRGKWEARHLRYLLPGAMAGIVVGALTFRYLNDDHIRLILGGIALMFSLHAWLARRRAGESAPAVPGPHRL
ncbi:MAG: sulfite exporter TauE/SafE family protein, partial [Alphaproteobacteria bacterium]